MKYKPKPMTKAEMQALRLLIEYNYADELRHWQEAGMPTEGHIYNSIDTLNEYVYKCHVIELDPEDREWEYDGHGERRNKKDGLV